MAQSPSHQQVGDDEGQQVHQAVPVHLDGPMANATGLMSGNGISSRFTEQVFHICTPSWALRLSLPLPQPVSKVTDGASRDHVESQASSHLPVDHFLTG